MSGFKDVVSRDLSVFLNVDEFAERHLIDGMPMDIVIDGNGLSGVPGSGSTHTDGIYKSDLVIYVSEKQYGPKPKNGKVLNLDGKKLYKIVQCDEAAGMYTLILEAYRA